MTYNADYNADYSKPSGVNLDNQVPANTCSPSNIFGGFEHTLFLGCSVMSFTASVGWNGQGTSLTVKVVEDECTAPDDHPKYYWNSSLNKTTTFAADPGFFALSLDIVGLPVYFRVEDFEFCGIVQSWSEVSDTGGRPTYTVVISDPSTIIEGVQLIVGEYAGPTGSTFNVFNCYGYAEAFGDICPQTYLSAVPPIFTNYIAGDALPDGAIFGTDGDGYGGANINDNGMRWNDIESAFNNLCNSLTPQVNDFGEGRVIQKGTSSTLGMGLIRTDSVNGTLYYVDLTELPTVPTYFRIGGSNVGLLDAINQVCSESGFDYYIELLPVTGGALDSTGIGKIIKIRTVDRTVQPSLGEIDSFIISQDNVTQSTTGAEWRNEPTNAFVIGAKRNPLFQIEQEETLGMIIPYWGLDTDGNMIVGDKDANDWWYFTTETCAVNEHLKVLSLNPSIILTEKEILAASAGQEMFETYLSNILGGPNETDLAAYYGESVFGGKKGAAALEHMQTQLTDVDPEKIAARDIPGGKASAARQFCGERGKITDDMVKIHEWVNSFNDMYGKQFAVSVPFTCARTDGESGNILLSETPTAVGWTEQPSVIQLNTDSLLMQKFVDDTGRITAMVRFDDINTKISNIQNADDLAITANKAWVRADVQEEYVFQNKQTRQNPRIVFSISESVRIYSTLQGGCQPEKASGLVEFQDNITEADAAKFTSVQENNVGGKITNFPGVFRSAVPDAASCGIQSNIASYGPWVNPGPPGKVVVQHEDGLAPWNYGSFAALDLAAQSIADSQITNMRVGEMGSITVPGYPIIPLGAELGAFDAGFYGAGTHLIDNRTHTLTYFFDFHQIDGPTALGIVSFQFSATWTGAYGPTVTGVNINVGPSGLTTSYSFRTFSPKFGLFAKQNNERMRNNQLNKVKAQKRLANKIFNNIKRTTIRGLASTRRQLAEKSHALDNKTPHEVFVGKVQPWVEGFSRPIVASESILDLPSELNQPTGKGMMSLDGLLRPISMDGADGMSQFVAPGSSDCDKGISRGFIGPIMDGSGGSKYYSGTGSERIDLDMLNPFTNPTGFARSVISAERSDTPLVGHDIDIIGRSGTGLNGTPDRGMILPVAGYDPSGLIHGDYKDDYKPMALKGPFVIKQWGYDLDGKPVPNKADNRDDAIQGIFTETGLSDKFLDNHLRDSETWPVAPLDLRLDRTRGVWTVPNTRPVPVTLDEALASGTGNFALATITTTREFYTSDGSTIGSPKVKIYDVFGQPLDSGTNGFALYSPGDCKHYILAGAVSLDDIKDDLECNFGPDLPGYDVNKFQVLTHGSGDGCLQWTDTSGCP